MNREQAAKLVSLLTHEQKVALLGFLKAMEREKEPGGTQRAAEGRSA